MKKKTIALLAILLMVISVLFVSCDGTTASPDETDTDTPTNTTNSNGLIISRIYIPNKGGDKFIAIKNAGNDPVNLKDYALKFTPAMDIGSIFNLPATILNPGKTLFCLNGWGMSGSWNSKFPTISKAPILDTSNIPDVISEDMAWNEIKANYKTNIVSIVKLNGDKYETIDTAPKMNRPCAYLRNINTETFKDEGWFKLIWDDDAHIKAIDTENYNGDSTIPPIKPDNGGSVTPGGGNENNQPENTNQTKPTENKGLGLPVCKAGTDNYTVEKNELIIGYNNTTHNPNWVTWHYTRADGKSTRNFAPEELLPDDWVKVKDEDYNSPAINGKYNRGHMCPSGDRSAMANETFTTANIIPQDIQVNRNEWADYEAWMRNETKKGYEYYSVAGPSVESDGSFKGLSTGLEIQIPSYMWRIGIIIDEKDGDDLARINNNQTSYLKAIAVWMPNDDATVTNISENWKDYIVSIDFIEEKTGIDFFSDVNDSIEEKLESQTYKF